MTTPRLEGFRWSFLGTAAPSTASIAYSVIATVVVLFGGLLIFNRMEQEFADVI